MYYGDKIDVSYTYKDNYIDVYTTDVDHRCTRYVEPTPEKKTIDITCDTYRTGYTLLKSENFPFFPLEVVGRGLKYNSSLNGLINYGRSARNEPNFDDFHDFKYNKTNGTVIITNTTSKTINIEQYTDAGGKVETYNSIFAGKSSEFKYNAPSKIIINNAQTGFSGDIHEATPYFPGEEALAKAKEAATAKIKALKNLTSDEQTAALKAVADAKDEAAINKAVADAEAKDKANLEAYKQTAKGEIAKLANLSNDEKTPFNNAVDAATDKEGVDKALTEAKTKDAENAKAKEALAKAKEQAKKDIAAMPELSAEQIKGYQDRVDQATTPEAVQAIVDEAKKTSDKLVADKAALEKAKTEALAKIDALKNLTEDEKTPYKDRINDAKDVPTIETAIAEATAEDAKKGSLKEAKAKAKEAIEKLENIKPEDKTAALEKVEAAKTTEEVATALEDAMKKDALEKAKKAAIAEVNALPNLEDTDKAPFIEAINKATDQAGIDQALKDAKAKDASNLQAAQEQAKAEVEALKNLSKDEKKGFTDRIDAVTKIADIQPIVDEAKKLDKENNDIAIGDVGGLINEDPTIDPDKKGEVTDNLNGKTVEELLAEAKKHAKNIINALPNLSKEEKAAFVAKVDEATTIPAVKQVVEDAKAQDAKNAKVVEAGDLIDQDPTIDPKDKDKAKEDLEGKSDEEILKAAKDSAKHIINTLPNLSDKDKEAFIKKVDDATTIPAVKAVVEEAKALDAAKKNAKDAIDKLANLDETAKNKAKEDITNAPDEAAVNKIVEDATAEDKKIADAKKTLDEQKQAAKEEIANLPNLSEDEIKDFNKKVDDATDKAGIDAVVEEAKAKSAENKKAADEAKALADAKQKAKEEINALPNLNDTEKAQYNKAVDEATDQAGIDKALAEAKAKDKENADAKTLAEAKETAKGVIDKLKNLPQGDKDKAKENIDKAETKEAIDKIVEDAKAKDKAEADRKAELQAAKDAAKAEIEALKNLTPDEKKEFINQVNAATKIEEIQPIVDAAKAKDLEKLNAAKKEAKDAIDNNEDIDPTKKDEIKEEIDKADTIDEVNEIVDKNTLTPEQKAAKELAKAKEEAKKEINALPNLSDEEKAKYCSDVDNATDKAGVEKALADAKNKDAENAKAAEDKKALDEAKAKAKAEIEALPELTPEQKKAFENEVDKATTPEAIKEIVDRAKEASDKAIADKQTLDEAKDAVKKAVDALENLSEEEKDAAKKAIDAATDKAGVDAALDAAKKLDELNKAKKDGKAEIDSDPNLPQDKKDETKDAIDKATTTEEVDKIVKDAKNEGKTAEEKKALEDAKNKAKDEIDKLDNLSQDEKDKAKSDIDNANDIPTVDKIVEEAKAKDKENADSKTSLDKAKEDAKKTIDELDNLTQDERDKAKEDIDKATDKPAIDKIVEEATAKDKEKADESKKSLDDKKNDAKNDVDKLGNLDDKDKQDAKDNIDKATTPEEVDKALEDAKNKDLDKAKDKAKKTIDELDKITDGQKEKGKDAVNNAKTVEEVKTIVEELERKNYENSIPSPAPNHGNKDNDYVNDYYYGDEGAYMRKPVKEEKKTEEVKKPEPAPAPTPSQAQLNLANVLKWIFKIDSPFLTKMMTRTSEVVTMDVAPFIRDNKTMLPLRYVAQTLGADVQWNATTRTATFTRNGLSASIQIDGNKIVMSDGRTVQMMAKPANVKARIFVPLTDVSKVFGLTNGNVTDGINQNIEWNGTARTVEIYTNR